MIFDVNIGEFLRLGGIYHDIEGSSPIEAYKSICSKVVLPSELSLEFCMMLFVPEKRF